MISYFIHFVQKHPVLQFTDSQTSLHDMQETMSFLKLAIYLFPHEVETLVQGSHLNSRALAAHQEKIHSLYLLPPPGGAHNKELFYTILNPSLTALMQTKEENEKNELQKYGLASPGDTHQ